MKNKFLILLAFALVVLGLIVFLVAKNGSSKIILFYSLDCLRCQAVEKFIQENQIEQKIALFRKEVSVNQENANQLFQRAKSCGLVRDNTVDLPLLWDGKKCLVGEKDVIQFFQGRM